MIATLNCESKELTFELKTTGQKETVSLVGDGVDVSKLQFFVVLAENDEVSIIDL